MSTPDTDIHAIILTLNEAKHIERCIGSIRQECASITVIDSGSTDNTAKLARNLGAQVIKNKWVNHATQINFGIDYLDGLPGWRLRIDADEYLLPDQRQTLRSLVESASDDTDGFTLNRRMHFMSRRMRWGAMEPSHQLRLWRGGHGRCEQRWMDEHIHVTGSVQQSDVVIVDDNLNSLTWWTDKHNHYASREAIDILQNRYGFGGAEADHAATSAQASRKRFIKNKIYNRLPAGLRSLLYFFYRYIVRFGWLDGRPGWYWAIFQAFWYRSLVDAKVGEIETYSAKHDVSTIEAIHILTGFDLSAEA